MNVGPLKPRQVDVENGKRSVYGEFRQNFGLHCRVIAYLSGSVVDGREVIGRGKDTVSPAVNIERVAARLCGASNLGGLVVSLFAVSPHEFFADSADKRFLVLRFEVAG